MNEKQFESLIVEKLIEYGYPKESIILEYPINRYRADIAITDVNTNIPIMIIEIKVFPNNRLNNEHRIFNQLRNYYTDIKIPVKAVGAIYNSQNNDFDYIDFTEAIKESDFEQKINNYRLPLYKDLIIGVGQKEIKQKEIKQERNIQILKVLCWGILPLLCLILLLLDGFEIYLLSQYRLTLIGILFLIVLIPCFSEITIGEISLKNNKKKNKEEQDNG